MLGFYFDNARCTGCHTCEVACADYHDLAAGRRFRRVIDWEGGCTNADAQGCVRTTAFVYHISLSCNHCGAPECVRVCPTGAMHKNDLGLVCVNSDKCIGCGYCTMACPYHAPSIDPDMHQSSKCDGCASRVARGGAPICVEACPLRALEFGDIDQLRATHEGCVESVYPLPDASYTWPNLLVRPSAVAARPEAKAGSIANASAIENNQEESGFGAAAARGSRG